MNTIKQIQDNLRRRSLLCVGLDPDYSKLPKEIKSVGSQEDHVYRFLTRVVDVTSPFCSLFKAQKAMFDRLPNGAKLLRAVITYIHSNYPYLPVIVDCKIGDIDNTMEAYIDTIFGKLEADGVVVNPLMGDDVLQPLMQLHDKAVVVLCKTSNPGGSIVQDALMADGRPLWEHLLNLSIHRWNTNGNMIPVVSSTANLDMAHVRNLIPKDMPILLAGVGAQGGSYTDLGKLLNYERAGVFVNSSRGILYPGSSDPWERAVQEAAIKLHGELQAQR